MIAGEDHDVIGIIPLNKIDILINRIRRTLVPVLHLAAALVRGQNMDAAVDAVEVPRLSVAYVIVQYQGLVLREHADRFNTGIDAVGEREIYDPVFSPVRDCRFRDTLCQDAEPAALPSGEQHGDYFLFWQHKNSSLDQQVYSIFPPLFFYGISQREPLSSF